MQPFAAIRMTFVADESAEPVLGRHDAGENRQQSQQENHSRILCELEQFRPCQ
jgi:hypothetical protein